MKLVRKAQAATEVAVFGAIIIFLIGMIIRTTISSQYAQNQDFKAMRFALAKSLESAKAGKTERNNATVLYIEDRLVPDFNKYGSLERTPFMATGSGSMSHLMMYPIDEADVNDSISKLDVYINGQYYPFTTAAMRVKMLIPPPQWPIDTDYPKEMKNEPLFNDWDYHCVCGNSNNGNDFEKCYACLVGYKIIAKGTPDYCYTQDECLTNNYLYIEEAYDLNRNGDFSDDPQAEVTDRSAVTRDKIAWQWAAMPIIESKLSSAIDANAARYPSVDIDRDRKEETVYGYNRVNLDNIGASRLAGGSIPEAQQQEMIADINDQIDLAAKNYPGGRAEIINRLKQLRSLGIVTDVMVVDYQDGDIDLSHDNTTPGMQRGVQRETAIYTRMRQEKGDQKDRGTYFLVKDGKAYNPEDGKFVRSINKRDQVDLVERHVLLSNNTWRFCRRSGATTPPGCIADLVGSDGKCVVAPNPVEVCVNDTGESKYSGCFSPTNVAKTCMDTKSNMIYVRSRIVNRGGHKWITDATDKRPEINIR